MDSLEEKLAKARANFQYDETKVMDGIRRAQWREWAGEIVTLDRDESQWVWDKLQRLDKLEELIHKIKQYD